MLLLISFRVTITYMNKKSQKNISFDQWVTEVFEKEVNTLDGIAGANSLIASAAIIMFSEAQPHVKKEFVRRVQDRQLVAYDNIAKETVDKATEARQADDQPRAQKPPKRRGSR